MMVLKKQDGFTLVELMVVVAVVGLLSSVAIPNFKKYQAKAKISEAKLQLASAYTAEQSFMASYSMYATCLFYMGYTPIVEKPSRYYTIGFNLAAALDASTYASAVNSGLLAAGCSSTLAATTDITYFLAGKAVGTLTTTQAAITSSAIGTQAATASQTFLIGAGGIIDGNFNTDATSSYLTIDNNKILSVVRQGY
jgi:type IV pilus assembly protein PilA